MKVSCYSSFIRIDGVYYCLSLAKCYLVEVADATLQYMLRKEFEKIPHDVLSVLQEALVVVPAGIDELGAFRASLFSKRFLSKSFTLTIAPTMLCNFKCPYCYESSEIRANGAMIDDRTAANILIVLNDCFNKIRFNRISVDWYGGEPLLGLKKISEIAPLINEFANKNGIAVKSDIVTNGSLLSADAVKTLLECGVETAQVTMDGAREIHNSRRLAKDGRPTFDIILNNIENALELGLKIRLRVNLDHDNVPTISELLEVLKDRGIYQKISFSIGYVSPGEFGTNPKVLSQDEYDKVNSAINLDRYGCSNRPNINIKRSTACSADAFCSLSVGPRGEIYSCWEHFGDESFIIGNINDGDFLEQKLRNASEYMTHDPTKIEECVNCKLLPICLGGCPYNRIQGKPTQCHEWKHDIEGSVRDYVIAVLNKKASKEEIEDAGNC